jgi:NADH-quinone oxidoreductase subunit J
MNTALLIVMVIAGMWTVMTRSLLKSAMGLAVTSAVITILMFNLNSPLAAVFELSVCAGLITAIFISTISLTRPLTHKEILAISKDRMKRYWYLPVIILAAGAALLVLKVDPGMFKISAAAPKDQTLYDVRNILWNIRQTDLFGQIVVILAGVFGVVILFKESKEDE